jgi:large subunit ribosomal protein L9
MQVILLEDVPNVGKKFEEHEVADGYGSNYLLPNGLARVANERTRAKYQKKKEQIEKKRQQKREEKAESLDKLDGASVVITAKTGEQGQLFAGIYSEDIADAINEQIELDTEITADDVDRKQPLQKVGEYEVVVSVLDTEASVDVSVEANS